MNMNNKKENISDSQLKRILKEGEDKTPQNPWFVRKVMNRLPVKKRFAHTGYFYALCLLAVMVSTLAFSYFSIDFFNYVEGRHVLNWRETLSEATPALMSLVVMGVGLFQAFSPELDD